MKLSSNKGSLIAVAMILAIVMAVGAVSYIQLCVGTMKRANRTFYYNSAINVAEAGAEEALYALNTGDWSKRDWNTSTADYVFRADVTGTPQFTDSNLTKGYFNVLVKDAKGLTPTITAEAVMYLAGSNPIRKQIRLYSKNANLFMPPFTAIEEMKLNGGEIDSYDMTKGSYVAAPREYDTTVASPTVTVGDINIGSPANIYGNVSVGVSSTNKEAFINSISGEIVGSNTTQGADGVVKKGSNLIDTNRISYDFSQDFPAKTEPTFTSSKVTSLPAADSNGYIVIGDPTGAVLKEYDLATVDIKTGETLLIVGPVQIICATTFSVAGQGAIAVLRKDFALTVKQGNNYVTTNYTASEKADCEIYARGNVSISGNGSAIGLDYQAQDPATLRIYGTATTSQTITIGGNGNFGAAVYAPKADITFNGGGSSGYFAGAVVGRTITVNGSGYRVRFPEQLGDRSFGSTYEIAKWVELTDRNDWYTF
jgi:hypothetical protein